MSTVDLILKKLIIERIQETTDPDLLDFIYKLLISESSNELFDTRVV